MKKEQKNLIHIKLEYDEALESKRDILSTKANLLRILRIIKEYQQIRLKELNKKTKLKRELSKLNLDLRKLKQLLPKLKIPEILKHEEPEFEELEEKIKEPIERKYDQAIENELEDIQDKLRSLE